MNPVITGASRFLSGQDCKTTRTLKVPAKTETMQLPSEWVVGTAGEAGTRGHLGGFQEEWLCFYSLWGSSCNSSLRSLY